jgi:hypothetical protein
VSRALAVLIALTPGMLVTACNALLGNEPGYYVESDGGGGPPAEASGDSETVGDEGPALAADATDALADTGTTQDSDAPQDSGTTAPWACHLDAAFSAPTLLASLNISGGHTSGAHLSADYLTAYYEYSSQLYSATRSAPLGDTFMSPALLASLNTADASVVSSAPTVSSDGLTIYFSSNRSGINQIYFATRTTVSGDFGPPAAVMGLPAGVSEVAPFLQGDSRTLYFLVNFGAEAGASGNDIYRATVSGPGQLTNIQNVTELNTRVSDGPIAVTADGLRAYFSRPESIDGGPAQHAKIWTATRPSTSAAFSNIVGVAELEGPDTANDDLAWVSNDGCQVTFSSFRLPGSNVFIARKP